MIKVKITTPNPLIPLIRQTPGKKGIWGNCEFFIDKSVSEVDWWFVMDGMQKPETVRVPRERTVLITSESEDMKRYDKKYLNQFGMIITSQRQIQHPRVIYASAHGWMIGHMGGRSGVDPKDYHKYFTPYDTLKGIKEFKKTKLISVFSSGKSRTPGQQLRLDFIEVLKKHFGERLDVFGVYEKYIADKWDGIAPYKYHISLENTARPDYWTEKLADAFLGGAYPLYWGAPNIYDRFPKESLTTLDISDSSKAIEVIEKTIQDNTYEKRRSNIFQAREMVLDKYNVFALIADLCSKDTRLVKSTDVTLTPEAKKRAPIQIVAESLKSVPLVYPAVRHLYRKIKKLS